MKKEKCRFCKKKFDGKDEYIEMEFDTNFDCICEYIREIRRLREKYEKKGSKGEQK